MKKVSILALVCILLLTGCGNKPPVQVKKNGGGTQAVTITDDSKSAPADIESSTPEMNDNISLQEESGEDIIEIKEKMFIAQTNDVYLNVKDYLGKTIKYEGIFEIYHDDESNTKYYSVIRYGPGCCGYDANAGFEVIWDGNYPNQNDWVEATGVLETYKEDDSEYLRLRLSSLTVLTTRGAENVYQ